MELWIRSQDKKILVPIKDKIELIEFGNVDINVHLTDLIYNGYSLGYYNNERALEVLDEIENILKHNLIINCNQRFEYGTDGMPYSIKTIGTNGNDIQELSTYVYDMPQE